MKQKYSLKIIWATICSSKIASVCYVILNGILTIALMLSGIFYSSLSGFMADLHQNRIPCRTILVNGYGHSQSEEENAEKIRSVHSHIIAVAHQDRAICAGNIVSMKTDGRTGDVVLNGCDESIMPKLTNQIPFSQSDHYCIIPERFYPDELQNVRNTDHYIDGEALIGTELVVTVNVDHYNGSDYYTIDHVDYPLLVVGTYDAEAIFNDENVCYTSFSLIGEMTASANDGSIQDDPDDHAMFVFADNVNNVNDILSSLEAEGYRATVQQQLNETAPETIKRMMNLICIALYSVSILLSAVLLTGMIRKSRIRVALLKALGFSRHFILRLFLHGYGIMLGIGYVSGLIITYALQWLIRTSFLERDHYFSKMQIICEPSTVFLTLIPLICVPIFLLGLISLKIDTISPVQLWKQEGRKK